MILAHNSQNLLIYRQILRIEYLRNIAYLKSCDFDKRAIVAKICLVEIRDLMIYVDCDYELPNPYRFAMIISII